MKISKDKKTTQFSLEEEKKKKGDLSIRDFRNCEPVWDISPMVSFSRSKIRIQGTGHYDIETHVKIYNKLTNKPLTPIPKYYIMNPHESKRQSIRYNV